MDKAEKWFDENSRKIMDFSDTNELVINEEKFLEFVGMQARKNLVQPDVIKSVCEHEFGEPNTSEWKFCKKCNERVRQ